MRAPTRSGLWLAGLLAAGCTAQVSLADVDRMQREIGVRTVLRQEGFTLWSPHDWVASKAWLELLEVEIPALQRALGLDAAEAPHVQVYLTEVEGRGIEVGVAGNSVTFQHTRHPDPLHGVAGWAAAGQVVIPIAPAQVSILEDGRELTSTMTAEHYRAVLRHELAHVHLADRALPEATWFSEGAADLVEGLVLSDGALVDRGAPRAALRMAMELDALARPLAALLDWREDGRRILQGKETVDAESRALCGLYLRWRMELAGDGQPVAGLLPRLEAVACLSRAEHLAHEAGWHAWLAGQAADPEPGEGP